MSPQIRGSCEYDKENTRVLDGRTKDSTQRKDDRVVEQKEKMEQKELR